MKIIYIKLTDEEYKELEEKARKEGYVLMTDYIKAILFSPHSSEAYSLPQNVNDLVSQITSRLERKVQDLINPFTSQFEDLKKRIAEIVERIDELESKIESKPITKEERLPQPSQRKSFESTKKEGEKKTAIDILNEQGVVFESELKLKNADAYFSKLEREGARIIYTEKERIALSQEFFDKFIDKLKEIKSPDPAEAESKLDPKEAKLFKRLVSEGLIIFDGEAKTWKPLF
ncbi:hypothetical protein [Sulfurisphaera ohwakuensis]|uniref:Gas vesicle protein n=1 Tax=Sulfurisphaera ohwakuensis TaxID=69656 RepID=A0A650CDJ7_SULOH|nr:hypothetical protein [Sulfurisphaera ohwakuensis]MBB5253231.1 gas vesicle protein [Sulfurisphaera ohwakuensis]QGR15862.1 hypothetical protein D1869_00635 [Sulfurisphaera ohwakuensis]